MALEPGRLPFSMPARETTIAILPSAKKSKRHSNGVAFARKKIKFNFAQSIAIY